MRAIRPSAIAAAPTTVPLCTASTVVWPIVALGASSGTLANRAARAVRASSEMRIPGAMHPPM